ncbi:MAG: prephenate dehydrogenase/arogenate dehydrogenase family protein [Chloroflexi bacterium]|nr:prephenate dehydrogenase/arogenate dehydrogenase family protein [Chloroflexota bacterium]
MDKISIIGLGLIGGSLGLALKKYDPDAQVTGFSRRAETLSLALDRGAIDAAAASLKEAVDGANLVIIATPILAARAILKEVGPLLPASSIVTDTGSTKVAVTEWAADYLPRNVRFIGGHPMAGKEKSGIEFAVADLFHDCTYCLTPAPQTDEEALDYVKGLVSRIKARPLLIDAQKHDHLVAAISHLPFLLSAALMELCAGDPSWPEMSQLASSGFRDMTRLASGDPVMYKDICVTNSVEISGYVDGFLKELERTRSLLHQPAGLEKMLREARQSRENWMKGR